MSALEGFIKLLRKKQNRTLPEIETMLERLVAAGGDLRKDIERWVAESNGWVRDHAVETGTHYKWELARGDGFESWRVFVHRFKEALPAESYAAVPHNHRYAFASALLRGGFTHCVLAEPKLGAEVMKTVLTTGQTYSITADPFHYLEEVLPGTVTLVVTLPAAKRYSQSVDPRTGEMRDHHPVCNMSIFP